MAPNPMIMQFVLMFFMQLGLAVPVFFLAKRMRSNGWLPAILTVVPILGWITVYVVIWRALFKAFDRIEKIEASAQAETFS